MNTFKLAFLIFTVSLSPHLLSSNINFFSLQSTLDGQQNIHNTNNNLTPTHTEKKNTNTNFVNLCPEGEYYDLNRNGCFPLCMPELGFDYNQFNANVGTQVYTLQNCTQTDLQNLINSIGSNGGIINVPACTITLGTKLFVPGNVIFQGAGIGQTIFNVQAGFTGHVLETKYISNTIIRDLTIDGKNEGTQAIVAWYTNNLLIERVEVKNSGRNGIDLRYIQNVTVRYCKAHNTGQFHGISSKDCSSNSNLATCISQAGNTAPGVLWTTSYSLYSNEVYNNGGHGINMHAINGEVAGNYSHDNGYSSKFFDAEDVLIHHNKFENSSSWGTHITSTLNIPDRQPRNICFYRNQFIGAQSDYPIRIAVADSEIYLIDNTYSGNANQAIRNSAASGVVQGCSGTQDMTVSIAGTALTNAPGAKCASTCENGPPTCSNYSNAGTIGYTGPLQITGTSHDPDLIFSTTTPTGGSGGTLEYKWRKQAINSTWTDLNNSNFDSYNPGLITVSTCFQRQARRDCQTAWTSSNSICFVLTTGGNCVNFTNPGSISYSGQTSTNSGYDPPSILNAGSPWGGIGGTEENQWQTKVGTGNWTDIAGAISNWYDPSALNATSCFRRKTKRSCATTWLNSNEICITINGGGNNTMNLCPEGEYYDVNRNGCFPLCQPQLGFDFNRFNAAVGSQVYTLQSCTQTDLQNLINSVGAAGGIVEIPACTILFSTKLFVPENVILQGAGMGQTIITVQAGFTGHVLETKYISNAIIRDLTIDGNDELTQAIVAWYTDNLLIERVEVKDSGRNGIDLRYIQNVTVRYCKVYNTGLYHGISSKDCSSGFDLAACQSQAGNTAPGVLWTTSYSLYSNEVYNNGSHGINMHAINGEVAGNYSHNNAYGSKFFDAEDVLIHHNKFESNGSWATHVTASLNIPDRLPRNLSFYQNQFQGSQSDYPVRIGTAEAAIYLIDNTYAGNVNEEIRNTAASGVVQGCTGTQDMVVPSAGTALTVASAAVCNGPVCAEQPRMVNCLLSLFLEGPFDDVSGTMNPFLYQNDLLPPGQPYAISPWNYSGAEGAGWTTVDYPVGTVDWVLVSLRTGIQAVEEIVRFAAILTSDGTVLPLGPVELDQSVNAVYIVVEQRNHLPAMTPVLVDILNNTITYDFRVNDAYVGNNGFGQKQNNGTWLFYAGNVDQSNLAGYEITGSDRIIWQNSNGLFDTYHPADFNLDRDINGLDNLIWSINNGISSSVPR